MTFLAVSIKFVWFYLAKYIASLLLSFFRDYDNQFKNLGKSITIERRVPNDQEMLREALDYLVKKFQD